jgi:hypothetical protein
MIKRTITDMIVLQLNQIVNQNVAMNQKLIINQNDKLLNQKSMFNQNDLYYN